jgi:hypothetical protein
LFMQFLTGSPLQEGKGAHNRMIRDRLLQYAARLRYPKLLVLVLVLFIVDLIVPDFIPFADEILLGLIFLPLAGLKKRKVEHED